MKTLARLLLCLLAWSWASHAVGDELRPGYLEFTQNDASNWSLTWKSPVVGGLSAKTQPILPDNCAISGEPAQAVLNAAVVSHYSVRCNGDVAGKRIGLSDLEAAQTDVLTRVGQLGRPVQATRLTAASPTAEIRARPNAWLLARTYFVTGVDHIVFGYDHLLFVVALVLLLRKGWAVAKAVTAFTLAHSLTLIGTTLGLFGLPQEPVEALIALSIVFLAVEIAKNGPGRAGLAERVPWIVAFLFGLVHGFGFAGALREIGLPEGDVPAALLSFNLGVEAGQLAIVGVTLLVLAGLRRVSELATEPAVRLASYGIGCTASFWLLDRLL